MRRALAALLLAACSGSPEAPEPAPEPAAEPPAAPDPARGRALMDRFECARCHEGTGLPEEPEARRCVGCHQAILAGTFDAPAARQRGWAEALHSLNHAPSLGGLAGHLRPEWIASFLLSPHDLRPGLEATMPRLPITEAEAADIAAALTEGASIEEGGGELDGDVAAGLALLEARGCVTCHAFTGALEDRRADPSGAAGVLAPDLRHTRERMTEAALSRWLRAPAEVRPGTPMPRPELSDAERADVARAILRAPLAPASPPPMPERLPLLDRQVRFAEVADRVLSRTCWHCHADPDFAQGDGGAGNTGGFGYAPRGVNLLDYAGASSGYVAEDGERRSLFAEDEDGTPHLIRVLMARHAEVRGEPVEGVTGMPLGLPPLPLEDIQLVESWIAQGRPN